MYQRMKGKRAVHDLRIAGRFIGELPTPKVPEKGASLIQSPVVAGEPEESAGLFQPREDS